MRRRFWVEAVLAGLSAFLGLLTLVWRDWIEMSGWDPDKHNGSAEWLVVVVLLALAVFLGGLARREARAAPAS
jgi:hypothetical protein